MDKLNKIGRTLYRIYVGIGITSIAIMSACVIFTVFARYIFGYSHKAIEEFITTMFAFSTFWGMGICFIEEEHVVINSIYEHFPDLMKRIVGVFNYIVTLIVLFVMFYFGAKYAAKFGSQISSGMEIPYKWMYGIIPTGCLLAIICVVVKTIKFISGFVKKEAVEA